LRLNKSVGEQLQLFVGEETGWIGLGWRRLCTLEVIRHEHGEAAGGDAQNEASFRIAGNNGVEKIELFEEGFEEPGKVHAPKLAAVAG